VQVRCHIAGTATDIGDRPDTGDLHELGDHGPVQRLVRKFGAQAWA